MLDGEASMRRKSVCWRLGSVVGSRRERKEVLMRMRVVVWRRGKEGMMVWR